MSLMSFLAGLVPGRAQASLSAAEASLRTASDVLPPLHATGAADGSVDQMSWIQTVVLSVVQGLTEFLPVSSSGHLRIVSSLFFGQDAGASFTAVVQLGTEAAVLVYFARDIWRIATGWFRGLVDGSQRGLDYRMGWMVIIGTLPVGIIGYLGKDLIRDNLRNLWVTAGMLVLFSFVFIAAERWGNKKRSFGDLTLRDAVLMGLAQCLALIPGVSRSGGTISAGLFLGLDREVAARFSFLLAIPAVLASGLFSLPDAFAPEAGQAASAAQLVVGTGIAFVVGYVSIAWLLKFVSTHSFSWFAAYRIPVGLAVIGLLAAGVLQP